MSSITIPKIVNEALDLLNSNKPAMIIEMQALEHNST